MEDTEVAELQFYSCNSIYSHAFYKMINVCFENLALYGKYVCTNLTQLLCPIITKSILLDVLCTLTQFLQLKTEI